MVYCLIHVISFNLSSAIMQSNKHCKEEASLQVPPLKFSIIWVHFTCSMLWAKTKFSHCPGTMVVQAVKWLGQHGSTGGPWTTSRQSSPVTKAMKLFANL